MNKKKNLTITIDTEIYKRIEDLVEFYEKSSITKVTKSDVIKHLVNKDFEKNVREK
ncbi:hypothetical protein ACI3ER_11865 [Bacillus sp. Wb]